MNEKNLIPLNKRTKSEQREIASSGGKASVQSRRKKKTLKDCMKQLLSLPVDNEEIREYLAVMGFDEEDADNRMMMTIGLFRAAAAGNVPAFRETRELIGEIDPDDKKLKKAQLDKLKADTERIKADTERIKAETELLRRKASDGETDDIDAAAALAQALDNSAAAVWRKDHDNAEQNGKI